jgi:hypothetical protein
MLTEFREHPSVLTIYMSGRLNDAFDDLTAGGAQAPRDLYDRFLCWIVITPRASPEGRPEPMPPAETGDLSNATSDETDPLPNARQGETDHRPNGSHDETDHLPNARQGETDDLPNAGHGTADPLPREGRHRKDRLPRQGHGRSSSDPTARPAEPGHDKPRRGGGSPPTRSDPSNCGLHRLRSGPPIRPHKPMDL